MTSHRNVADNYRPCLILAHQDAAYSSSAARAFRRHGWDVYPARSGPEVRRLARILCPELTVLGTDLPGESGWLTCDKLTSEHPDLKVMLVDDEGNADAPDFASFVGAAGLVDLRIGAQALVEESIGDPVSAIR